VRACATLQHLPSVTIFVMDFTGESGSKSSIDAQLAVRKELQLRYPDKQWVDVVSKADLELAPDVEARIPAAAMRISSKSKVGMRELMKWIGGALERQEQALREREERLLYEREAERGFR
jgi:GTP1/Obg family GTP-binding protein